jgi:hypothetical protein
VVRYVAATTIGVAMHRLAALLLAAFAALERDRQSVVG